MHDSLTWGDVVRVKAHAPAILRPGAFASVVAIGDVETPEHAARLDAPIGTRTYLIEFGDGEAIEVAADWIEPVHED